MYTLKIVYRDALRKDETWEEVYNYYVEFGLLYVEGKETLGTDEVCGRDCNYVEKFQLSFIPIELIQRVDVSYEAEPDEPRRVR